MPGDNVIAQHDHFIRPLPTLASPARQLVSKVAASIKLIKGYHIVGILLRTT
jgi:hypothetical protein